MSTIPYTINEFNKALSFFFLKEITKADNSQESIGNCWKGLLIHYMGLFEVTDDEIERCSIWIKVAEASATRRGWLLEEPHLEREV